jgi:hypothetical protein
VYQAAGHRAEHQDPARCAAGLFRGAYSPQWYATEAPNIRGAP